LQFLSPWRNAVIAAGGQRRMGYSHLRQKFGPQAVAPEPGLEKRIAAELRFCRGPFQKLAQHRTAVVLPATEYGLDQHAAHFDEEFLPEHPRFLQALRAKRLYLKAASTQSLSSRSHGLADFRHDGSP